MVALINYLDDGRKGSRAVTIEKNSLQLLSSVCVPSRLPYARSPLEIFLLLLFFFYSSSLFDVCVAPGSTGGMTQIRQCQRRKPSSGHFGFPISVSFLKEFYIHTIYIWKNRELFNYWRYTPTTNQSCHIYEFH